MFEQITHIDEEKKRNRHFNEKKDELMNYLQTTLK